MALAFQKPQPTRKRAKVLLLGEAGSGKTHAALTFPRPAVIDAEGSSGWFADRFAFESVPTKSYADARDLIKQLRANPGNYETLVIDSLTSIYNGLLNVASTQREDLRPLDWGRIKRKFSQLLDELYHQLPMHVVCIGWIKPQYAAPGTTYNGKVVGANDLVQIGEAFDGDKKTAYAFDFIFKLIAEGGKHSALVVKSRAGQFREGQRIADFSWKTLEPLFAAERDAAEAPRGMSDDEQAERDAAVLEADPKQQREAPPKSQPAEKSNAAEIAKETFEIAVRVGMCPNDKEAFKQFIRDRFAGYSWQKLLDEFRATEERLKAENRDELSDLMDDVDAQLADKAAAEAPPPERERDRDTIRKHIFAICGDAEKNIFGCVIGDDRRHQISLQRYAKASLNDLTDHQIADFALYLAGKAR